MRHSFKTSGYTEMNLFDLVKDVLKISISTDVKRTYSLIEKTKIIRGEAVLLKFGPLLADSKLANILFEKYSKVVEPVMRDLDNYRAGVCKLLLDDFDKARREFEEAIRPYYSYFGEAKVDDFKVESPAAEPRFKNSDHIFRSLS